MEHFLHTHEDVVRRLNAMRRKPLKPGALLRVLRRAGLITPLRGVRPLTVACEVCGWTYVSLKGLPELSQTVYEHFRSRHPEYTPSFYTAAAAVEMEKHGLITVKPKARLRGAFHALLSEATGAVLSEELSQQRGRTARVPARRVAARLWETRVVGRWRGSLPPSLLRSTLAGWVGRVVTDGRGRLWRAVGLNGGLLLELTEPGDG